MTIKRNINFSVLDQAKIKKITEASFTLMQKVGMKFGSEDSLKRLKDAGAKVNNDGLVFIPEKMVEAALKSVPKELVLYTRDGKPNMTINQDNQVYFGTHADQLEILDPLTGQARKFLHKDIKTMCLIADYLPNIHFVLSVGLTSDIRPEVQTQTTFLETVKNFNKTINFSTNDIESLQEVIDMAAVVAGGLDKLQEKPFIFNYCEPIPPLSHPLESVEKLRISAENRIPVVYMPYCMMGGTSPMSMAASLAQCTAEVFGGLVLHQLVSEGAPFIWGTMPSIFDMKTTIGSYGAPEFHLGVAAMADISNNFGIPFYGTAGCSDAKYVDEQSVAEVTMELFSTLLSKANIVHDVGVLDHCNSVAPEVVVLADEIIEGLKHYSQGVSVTDQDLALDVIEQVGPAGHYLNELHTADNFKSVWYPKFFSRKMVNEDYSEIKFSIKDKITDILENHKVPALDSAILKELAQWEAKYK